jgi:hypothetical protein
MFGLPIDGPPANVFFDNSGVVKNTTIPESRMLTKKHNTLNYHAIREVVAVKILQLEKEDGMTNLAHLFTRVLTADHCHALFRHIMY